MDEYSWLLCYPFFPHTRLLQLDDGSQEPDATTDEYYYYPEGAYYYVEAADDQE